MALYQLVVGVPVKAAGEARAPHVLSLPLQNLGGSLRQVRALASARPKEASVHLTIPQRSGHLYPHQFFRNVGRSGSSNSKL